MNSNRGRWVAWITGALSILIGLLYLVLVTVLDRQGPLRPPPPEAYGAGLQAPASAENPEPGRGPDAPGGGEAGADSGSAAVPRPA